MTNDEKITTIAKLLREMSDEFGDNFGMCFYREGELFYQNLVSVTVGNGHGSDADPTKALTLALSDHERKVAEKEIRAEVEAGVKARMALRKAA